MKKIVVLSGAGMSAESGIKTFRDADGLWEGHDVMQVASPEGFARNPALVLEFYNQRRRQLHEVQPNAGHLALKDLEKAYDLYIVTQNVDDLHERAGSSRVLHLHGELRKVRSTANSSCVYDWPGDLVLGDLCPQTKAQLRPHIVWFGESVPLISKAAELVAQADVLIIVGTSMQVYPAAGLVHEAPSSCKLYYLDPKPAHIPGLAHLELIRDSAAKGLPRLVQELLEQA